MQIKVSKAFSMTIEYGMFHREELELSGLAAQNYDLFISAFNDSERVSSVFGAVVASRKIWLIHPEYEYEMKDRPKGHECFEPPKGTTEPEFWRLLIEEFDLGSDLPHLSIAIDITGMMRPHLLVMPLMLKMLGVKIVDVFYADPTAYLSGSETKFSKGLVQEVAQIGGLEGLHTSSLAETDVLIIGAGYDDELVHRVAESKRSAHHLLMMGLPGLQAHMYQESQLRMSNILESVNRFSESSSFIFAPANNPFMTARELQSKVSSLRIDTHDRNIYLTSVGPKPQVLGFALYFLCEGRNGPVSVVFPYTDRYSRETSIGLSRVNRYVLELDWVGN